MSSADGIGKPPSETFAKDQRPSLLGLLRNLATAERPLKKKAEPAKPAADRQPDGRSRLQLPGLAPDSAFLIRGLPQRVEFDAAPGDEWAATTLEGKPAETKAAVTEIRNYAKLHGIKAERLPVSPKKLTIVDIADHMNFDAQGSLAGAIVPSAERPEVRAARVASDQELPAQAVGYINTAVAHVLPFLRHPDALGHVAKVKDLLEVGKLLRGLVGAVPSLSAEKLS